MIKEKFPVKLAKAEEPKINIKIKYESFYTKNSFQEKVCHKKPY